MNNPSAISHRNPAIELYRVVLMFLIVLHHAAYHGLWNHEKGLDACCPSLYWLFTALTIWHVDGFLSITGWFGSRFTISRFAKIWGVIAFYSLLSMTYGWWVNGVFSRVNLAGGWFGHTYLYFLFLLPILNAAVEWLAAAGKRKLFIAWTILDIGIVLNWAPCHLFTGVVANGAEPFTIMTFIAVYLNMRLLRISGLMDKIMLRHLIAIVFLFLISVGLSKFSIVKNSYNSPLVMLMAFSVFVFFERFVRVHAFLSRITVSISPLMFGVFILHETTLFGRLIYKVPQQWMVERCSLSPVVIVFLSAGLCFVVCVIFDALRRWLSKPFIKHAMPYVSRVDNCIMTYVSRVSPKSENRV